MLTLYSPFDVIHNGDNGNSAAPQVTKPPLVVGDAFGGCGRAAIAIRQLTGAEARLICIEGRLSGQAPSAQR
jgi:hypothetical protein